MDRGYKIHKIEQLSKIDENYTHIYFGSDCCDNLVPQFLECKKIMDFCKVHDKTLVLLFPFLTDGGFKRVETLMNQVKTYKEKINLDMEITINDFGMLDILKDTSFKLNCGRLLIKTKKGPEITGNLLDSDPSNFKKNSLLNPHYIQFLKSLGIERFELDLAAQGVELPDNINATLYVGFSLISVTRRCPFIDCDKDNYTFSIKECKKECQSYVAEKRTQLYDGIIMKGNAEFIKSKKDIPIELKGKFNRVVVTPSILHL